MSLLFLVYWGDLNLWLAGWKESLMGNDPKSPHQKETPIGPEIHGRDWKQVPEKTTNILFITFASQKHKP